MESIAADGARRSLDAVAAARLDVAERVRAPWWYYPALGVLVAQMVLAYGLLDLDDNPRASLLWGLSLGLEILGSFWLQRTYARRTGFLIRSPRSARGWVAFAAFLIGLGAPFSYISYLSLADNPAQRVVLAAALVTLVATAVLGSVYDKVQRAELRQQEGA